MKWILATIGVLAVLAGGILIVGYTLPQNHTASRTTRLSKPPERVWQLVTDVASYPSWRTEVDSVEQLPPHNDNMMWREITRDDKLTFEAITSDAPFHFVARISDTGLPFGGNWDYRITPDGDGSRITITENGEVYNPVFRFVSKFFMGHTATIDRYLTDLSTKLGDSYAPGPG